MVNNAGIMPTHPLLQQTEQEITKTFQINVMAHFWVLQRIPIVFNEPFLTLNQPPYFSSSKPYCRT